MSGAGMARRCAWSLGWCLIAAGCLAPQGTPRSQAPEGVRVPPPPHPVAPAPPAPGASNEIPLVPVPPPPLAGDRTPVQPNPSIRPAAAQVADPPAPPPVTTRQTEPARLSARDLIRQAGERYAGIDSYIVRMTRRETVRGKPGPEEIILFKFRKEPWSLHFKWLGETARGREVVYVKGLYENKIHTLLAAGDAPFLPAGKRISLAADSPMVRSASRHPITEAGIGALIASLESLQAAQERGDRSHGTLTVAAPQNRIEYPRPVDALEQVIPAGVDPDLPRGGRRLFCFDPEWNLPLLVIGRDERGVEVEYYRYDRLQTPVRLDADDFNPDKLWAPRPARPAGPSGTP